jgi:hypothetical protein
MLIAMFTLSKPTEMEQRNGVKLSAMPTPKIMGIPSNKPLTEDILLEVPKTIYQEAPGTAT